MSSLNRTTKRAKSNYEKDPVAARNFGTINLVDEDDTDDL
jgi:hypothetical protein